MWARNLLFIGLVLAGFAALRASLFPLNKAARASRHVNAVPVSELTEIVAPVDAAFRTQWDAAKVQPTATADNLTIVRRLSLALTGTIPSIEELRKLEQVPDDQQVAWWLGYLLQDRRYADYFAERLARAYVGTEDGPFLTYRRRRFLTWLSDQLLAKRPYGELVQDMVVSDGLWTDKPATNFITVTFNQATGRPDADRLAGRVARAFLGIRLDCAQCHDHPFDDNWKQQDFHALAAFFGQTQQGLTGIFDGSGEHEMEIRKTGKRVVVEPAVLFKAELMPHDGTRRSQLARWLTTVREEEKNGTRELVYNEYFARATVQRVWALMFNRPLLDSVESMDSLEHPPQALVLLARDFAQHRYDLQRLIRVIAATQVFRLDSAADHEITEEHEKAWAVFPLTRLRPEQVVGSVQQAASVRTINAESNLITRVTFFTGEKDFVKRYGDTGDDEFAGRGGTIPQRLLMMNGNLVTDKTRAEILHASNLIGTMAPTDRAAVETAFLAVLTRRPSQQATIKIDDVRVDEWSWFERRLAGSTKNERGQRMEDLFWALINSTEFSWNH